MLRSRAGCLTGLAILAGALVIGYWMYGVWIESKWGQYLPSTDITP